MHLAARIVQPELLDILPPEDPGAQRSRRELRLVNRLMGHCRMILQELRAIARFRRRYPKRIVELGAGDGSLLLQIARHLAAEWPTVDVFLLDRQNLVTPDALTAFESLGWRAHPVSVDLTSPKFADNLPAAEVMLTNLVLHHLDDNALRRLFMQVAARNGSFIATEPRRSVVSLMGSRSLALLGCGPVTLHDAEASVRAGFDGDELSRLWPQSPGWRLTERKAGLFSHLFVATHDTATQRS